jgi:hypothetical protein
MLVRIRPCQPIHVPIVLRLGHHPLKVRTPGKSGWGHRHLPVAQWMSAALRTRRHVGSRPIGQSN